MEIIQHCATFARNPVFDLELGLAIVALALAIEAFIKRNHVHGCLYGLEMALVGGLAICAALAIH
jgi:hypothetical protein